MSDLIWCLWKALPFGVAAVAWRAIGTARMMVWVGVRIEAAGASLAQAGVDYQNRSDARRDRVIRRLFELQPKVQSLIEEAKA